MRECHEINKTDTNTAEETCANDLSYFIRKTKNNQTICREWRQQITALIFSFQSHTTTQADLKNKRVERTSIKHVTIETIESKTILKKHGLPLGLIGTRSHAD